jgi:PhnB protein
MAQLTPYLNFHGAAREAMEFYRDVFGGDLVVTTYAELGHPDEAQADKVMHSQLDTPDGFTLMAADLPDAEGDVAVSGMNVVVSGDEPDLLRGFWQRLAEGAQVRMPLERQVWGDEYGDLVDRFGVPWGFNISTPGDG